MVWQPHPPTPSALWGQSIWPCGLVSVLLLEQDQNHVIMDDVGPILFPIPIYQRLAELTPICVWLSCHTLEWVTCMTSRVHSLSHWFGGLGFQQLAESVLLGPHLVYICLVSRLSLMMRKHSSLMLSCNVPKVGAVLPVSQGVSSRGKPGAGTGWGIALSVLCWADESSVPKPNVAKCRAF